MNQLSYEVSFDKISALGYAVEGSLKSGIKSTIELLKQAQSSKLTIL